MAVATQLSPEQIAGMTAAQLRAELKSHFEAAAAIEKKYPDGGISDAADETEIKRLLDVIDKMEDRLAPIELGDAQKRRILEGAKAYGQPATRHRHASGFDPSMDEFLRTPGQQFVESAQFKALIESGVLRSNSNKVELAVALKGGLLTEHKALFYSGSAVGGPFVQNDVQPGLRVPLLLRELSILDLIPRVQTNSDAIEYVREDTFTNASTGVAEATVTTGTTGLKPESTLAYSTQTSAVRTIAHWIPVTNRMLADAPAMRGIIDSRLLLGLDLTLESQIATGSGSGEDFTGIVNASGVNIVTKGTDNIADAIFKGRTLVRTTGKSRPTAVLMNPTDWQTVRLARENAATGTLGGYLMGPPSVQGPQTMWGLPVVETEGIAAGTAIVGDFAMGCTLFDREEATVRVGYINDQFVRNMQTLLAELRAAFVVWRGAAFTKVTGL